jgi:hypothetical protein
LISFRYHLVSIVAVFLALALGIVVGTTALSGPITRDLRSQLNDTKKQRTDLANQVKSLQGQVDDSAQFASTYGSQLVAGTLTGKSVLVVALPGATGGVQSGITKQIGAAGGKISGVVTVTKNYLDPRLGSGINSLATGAAHPIGWTAPETSDPGKLGGSLLSYVLLGKGKATELSLVLGGFSGLHMVSVDSGNVTPSSLVVVLGHGTHTTNSKATATELDLVDAMAQTQGSQVVVAGNAASATGGGLLAGVRDSSADRSKVSTVDDADNAFGQVSTVLALSNAAKNQFGHFGTQNGADSLFPAPPK